MAAVLLGAVAVLLMPAGAAAKPPKKEPKLQRATYPDMTHLQLPHATRSRSTRARTPNLFGLTKTCPNATKVSGPGDTSVFAPGSTAEGYVTRFKPSMVEVLPTDGSSTTPSVWDLHLHHVVWLGPRRADVRVGRGEDDRQGCRRATGSRSAATRPGASTT